MFEAACADEHEGEEDEVVGGVDEGAGGEGASGETGEAEDEADAEEKDERDEEDKAAPKNHNLERSSERGQRHAYKTQGGAEKKLHSKITEGEERKGGKIVEGKGWRGRAEEIPEAESIRPQEGPALQQCAPMSDTLLGMNNFQSDLNNMRCIKRREYHRPYGMR